MNVTWNTSNRKLNLFQTGSENTLDSGIRENDKVSITDSIISMSYENLRLMSSLNHYIFIIFFDFL